MTKNPELNLNLVSMFMYFRALLIAAGEVIDSVQWCP
jgi:hypothetical protein